VFLAAARATRSVSELGVEPDWKAAVDAAQRQETVSADPRLPRLDVQVFGADVTPPMTVLNAR
jgi:hypothetical protein